jgi:Carboxypeptidase regulatory-like domain/TonB-dependent Receptor Plug Domain/TonB dependent receptor
VIRRLATIAAVMWVAASVATGTARAQGLTGQLSGTVMDAGGGVMPGVTVVVRNEGTNQARETTTGADGSFVFPDLLAGTYRVTVKMQGFKTFEQSVSLTAQERVALRPIHLEVGGVSESVSVQAEAPKVQTTTGERSAVITQQQIEDTGLKGRDFMGVLKVLPGVVDTSSRDAPGWGSVGGLSVNGRTSFNFSYDGVTNKDTGSNSGNWSAPGLDSIGEIRVQSSNFQAEYGRSSGATITVVTKSGTHDFHGSGAFYKRDEALNANEWARNRQNLPKPIYRYDNTAYTVGGPVVLPKTNFNKGRDRLFFFWSQDLLPRTDPGALNTRTMPTALERKGDFSQTFDSQGRLVFIRDPLASGTCNVLTGGPACFPGNVIPANRIDPTGQAILNLMPLPNAVDPSGTRQYNYTYQTAIDHPRSDQVLRVDLNISPASTFYSRVQFGYEAFKGGVYQLLGSTGGWPQFPVKYEIPTFGIVNTLLHTWNPTTFSEFTFGVNHSTQNVDALTAQDLTNNQRAQVLNNLPQFFPSANPLNIVPNASFAGTNAPPNVASIGVQNRFYFKAHENIYNVSSNLTKVLGKHNLKAGIFVEHTLRPATRASSFNRTFSFNGDNQNPFNTNYGFANALTGAVSQYTESTASPYAHGEFDDVEFFAQDNWRLKPRFTIDGGVRFYYVGPTVSKGQQVANFDPAQWSASKAPQLYQPAIANGVRVARNPLTGDTLPAVFIGRIVPGSGDVSNGMVVTNEKIWPSSGVLPAPRIGFAWDMFGDGSTAVRGGFGVFYDRYQDDEILQGIEQPPLLDTRTTNYTTIAALFSSPLTQTPQSVRSLAKFKTPTVDNWSIGVQRTLPWKFVADVAYVGNHAFNQLVSRELNGLPYGSTFQAQYLDPTNNNQPLPNDLIRPYRGYAGITQREFSGYGDYHSIQVSANRRTGGRLSFGVAYTGSISRSLSTIDPFIADNVLRNYTLNGSRPHIVAINYSYLIPALPLNNGISKAVTDGWQVTGITSILSGSHQGFTLQLTGVSNINGAVGAPGSRVDVVCNPNLPRGQRTLLRQFKTECIQAPSDPNRLGNSTSDEYINPGYINHDISIFKNIALPWPHKTLQFRCELYNALNAMEVSSVNTTAVFDTTGKQTNTAFGQVTAARDSRRIQLALRFTF